MKPFVCLSYHQISSQPDALVDPYTVSPRTFAQHMKWLNQRGYKGVSISQALENSQDNVIALSFDDGYIDFFTTAWPILQHYGYSATVFVVTRRVGQRADWWGASNSPLMNWGQISTLAHHGIEIGSHAAEHTTLNELPVHSIHEQLVESHHIIFEQTGIAPAGLAYPYGHHTEEVCTEVRRAGYSWGCTARGGRNHSDTPLFRLRRTLITGKDQHFITFAIRSKFGYATGMDIRMDLRKVR